MEIKFEDLPQAVAQIFDDLREIKGLIIEKNSSCQPETDRWFSVDELCKYLPGQPAHATVYGWVHIRAIPHKKFRKRLAFLKSEIDSWLKDNGRKTLKEIEAEAENYLAKSKKRFQK